MAFLDEPANVGNNTVCDFLEPETAAGKKHGSTAVVDVCGEDTETAASLDTASSSNNVATTPATNASSLNGIAEKSERADGHAFEEDKVTEAESDILDTASSNNFALHIKNGAAEREETEYDGVPTTCPNDAAEREETESVTCRNDAAAEREETESGVPTTCLNDAAKREETESGVPSTCPDRRAEIESTISLQTQTDDSDTACSKVTEIPNTDLCKNQAQNTLVTASSSCPTFHENEHHDAQSVDEDRRYAERLQTELDREKVPREMYCLRSLARR